MNLQIQEFLSREFLGNSVSRYLATAAIFAAGILVLRLVIQRVVQRVKKLAEQTSTTIDDFLAEVLESVALPLLYCFLAYGALKSLALPVPADKALNYAGLAAGVYFLVKFLIALTAYGFTVYLRTRGSDSTLKKSLQGILTVVKFVIWGGAVIFLLDNMGFKVSAVLAGLGIGGVAVALAAQAVLKDLFSYFCILFDRPFVVGDFIIVGDYLGTIEHIGIKTTRIRSLSGEMLIFSNSDLTDSRVRNYKLMERRRVLFQLKVVYQTPLERVKEIPIMLAKIIKGVEGTVFDRAHFLSFGDFSLDFEVVYYVIGGDYNKYMDIQQQINFAVMREFAEKKIEFAYPSQTVFLQK
ncbi:MAG: mechanosensitive ion channel family protein [Candidatus Omnitrophica bacterium]|jgi:small-conductance mechanosensitive channel|nr:mechanosensitive ion channel family protein [Candidatus Omnitrophota bacterium]